MNRSSYGPSRVLQAAILALALVLGYVAASLSRDGDRPGSAMVGLGALAFLAAALWLASGPIIVLDETGVTVRSGLQRKHLPWSEVDNLGLTSHRRRGLTQHNLEIESGQDLMVFPDFLLGGRLDELVAESARLRS